jgi:PBSX family phage portal protein
LLTPTTPATGVTMSDNIEEDQEIVVSYVDDDLVDTVNELTSTSKSDPFNHELDEVRKLDGLSMGTKRKITNNINKFHRGQSGAKSKSYEVKTGYGQFDVITPLYNLEYLAQLPEKNAVLHSAIQAKVANTVSLGFQWSPTEKTLQILEELELKDGDAQTTFLRKKVARLSTRMDEWVESLNEEDNLTDILEKVMTDYEALGMGYLEVGRTSTGKVGYLGHIPAWTIRPRRLRDGFVQIVEEHVTFFRNFGDKETVDPIGDDNSPNELIMFKKYTPRSSYYGIPDIIPALSALAGMEFAKQYNLDYFEHKAVPRHLILVKGGRLGPEAEKRLVNFFKTNVKGKHHRAVYVPIPEMSNGKSAELEIRPIEADIQDSSFHTYIEMNRDEILMAYRVPGSRVGLTSNINLAVARDSDKMFKEQVARPLQRKIERRLNQLFVEMTDVVMLELIQLTLTDEETKSKIHEKYLRYGVLKINEIRQEIGYKAMEDGDEPFDLNAGKDSTADSRDQKSQARAGRKREQEEDGMGPRGGSGTQEPNGSST